MVMLVRPLLKTPATSLAAAGGLDARVATAAAMMVASVLFMVVVSVQTELN
jgi:hypothetical protein